MAAATGSVKLRLFLAVGEEGQPHEVGAVTVPMRVTMDAPGRITIHATEAVEKALQAIARALEELA